jgi:peptidoglycan/xylan/chitin deacetylase (PgdA/CDA1 family)
LVDELAERDLVELVREQRPLPALGTMITFDDGYRDNYDRAYPVLKRSGVPAIFFIPTARQLGWWDIIAFLIKHTDRPTIESVPREQAISHYLRRMKLEPHAQTSNLLPQLAEACGVALPDRARQDAELMTWDQIREVAQRGIAIGSHTHSHRVLATIPVETQREELATSKSILERELGQPVRSLSYPVGNYQHFTNETQSLAAECGYAVAFSFNTGVNTGPRLTAYDVKRVGPPNDVELLAAMAAWPALFAGAK